MHILLFSDIHGHTETFPALSQAMGRADLICLCGDITSFKGPAAALQIIRRLNQPFEKIVAVSGNCDNKGVEEALTNEGIGIDGQLISKGGVSFFGMGGSLTTPFATPNEFDDAHYQSLLDTLIKKGPIKEPLIILSHQPPYGSCADRLASGVHSGSKALSHFIDTHAPLACLTGHIHESFGMETRNETLIVNPGSLAQGKWAELHLFDGKITARLNPS